MAEAIQDDDLVKFELAELDRMKSERAPWESHYRECEERANPVAAGGFSSESPGNRRGQRNFDQTAVDGVERFAAAMCDITVPLAQQYISVEFGDGYLDSRPEVQRWCVYAGGRLHAIRYAAHTMFHTHATGDFMQLGTYGTSPFWTSAIPHIGMWYKALPFAECYFDEDYAGVADTVRRSYCQSARQLEQRYGRDSLTPRIRKALDENKPNEKFEILHTVRPNRELQAEAMDWRGKPVASIVIAQDEKVMIQRKGFNSMPITVSRHVTSPGEKYGRSPTMKLMPSINTANAMAQTNLRAGHKAVDPALAFFSDDGIRKVITRPGGMNPGMVDEEGRMRVARLPGGENGLPIAMEMLDAERQRIDTGFLGLYFKLLTDDKVQRSATAVLEMASQKGVLVSPYAARFEAEKENPITQREFDLALEYGQIQPPPPVVMEAGARPRIKYLNPLRRMAQAQEAAGLTRLVEVLTPFENGEPGIISDVINIEKAGPGVARVLGVRADWTRSEEEIAARREQRAQAKAQEASLAGLEQAAGATLDLTKAGDIARSAA